MTGTYTPETVGVPKELLLEDFKQQCTNLQGQYTRMHNRMQLMIGLNTALLPTLGAVFLASSKGDVGRPWLVLFPVTGLLLSAIGFLTGATDRRLVTIYRGQLSWTAKCVLSAYVAGPYEYQGWLHIGLDPTGVSDKLDKWSPSPRIEGEPFRWRQMTKRTWWLAHMASWWNRTTSWRWEPLSVTRLPVALSLAFFVIWLIILIFVILNTSQ
jgi:hypothetical protein